MVSKDAIEQIIQREVARLDKTSQGSWGLELSDYKKLEQIAKIVVVMTANPDAFEQAAPPEEQDLSPEDLTAALRKQESDG